MTRISRIYVLSGALTLLAVAVTSSAHAIEINAPKVQVPHVNVPQVKPPQTNTHINTPQLKLVTPGGNNGKSISNMGNQGAGKASNTTLHAPAGVLSNTPNTGTVNLTSPGNGPTEQGSSPTKQQAPLESLGLGVSPKEGANLLGGVQQGGATNTALGMGQAINASGPSNNAAGTSSQPPAAGSGPAPGGEYLQFDFKNVSTGTARWDHD